MADGHLYVGKEEALAYEWWGLEPADKPTSVDVSISRTTGGLREYLQADDTWGETVAYRTASSTTSSGKRSEWTLVFTPPSSARGSTLRMEAFPTGPLELGPQAIHAYVTTADEDSLADSIEALNDPDAAAIADAVWDEVVSDHQGANSTGKTLYESTVANDPSRFADAVWDEARNGHTQPGTFGETASFVSDIRTAVQHPTYGLEALDADLNALLARVGSDGASMTLHDKLGAFTTPENLRVILGDLSSTRRLGQVLGAFTEGNNLKALLGPFTVLDNLKAVLGAFTAAQNVRQALTDHEAARATDTAVLKDDLSATRADVAAHRTAVEADVDAIHTAVTSTVPDQLDAHDAAVLAVLQDASSGLAALKSLVDDVLGRIGQTTDTGGTTATGSAMAKLNKSLEVGATQAPADVEWTGVEPVV